MRPPALTTRTYRHPWHSMLPHMVCRCAVGLHLVRPFCCVGWMARRVARRGRA